MAEYLIKDTTLRDLADEIRRETGKTDQLLGVSMADELRTFSDSLAEEIALQNAALDDLEAELNSLEEGSGGSDSNKLVLVVDEQSADNLYEITEEELVGATKIRNYAFNGCVGLSGITLPDSLNSIGSSAFSGCRNLSNITIPANITSIGSYAFDGSNKRTTVYYRGTLAQWLQITFGSPLSNPMHNVENIFINGEKIDETLIIPNSIDEIKAYAFYAWKVIKNVLFENNSQLISIGNNAFSGSGITAIELPEGVVTIGDYAISDCGDLTTVIIPASTTKIGHGALRFSSFDHKCSFIFKGENPPTIENDTFRYPEYIEKIIVPAGCGETYKTATNWTTVADYIEEAAE